MVKITAKAVEELNQTNKRSDTKRHTIYKKQN
jgi:hypothetical protein